MIEPIDDQRLCRHCGRVEDLWQDYGVNASDQGYCCRGCAEDYVCTCDEAGLSDLDRFALLDFNHESRR